MKQKAINNVYNQIQDKIENILIQASQESSRRFGENNQNFYLNYRDEVDSGRVIAGIDENDNLEYAYRIIFDSEDNQRNRVYWCRDGEWEDEMVLIGESGHIVGNADWCSKYSDSVSQDDVKEIENLFEELEQQLQNFRNSFSLDDVIDAILDYNYEFLQNSISPDEDAAIEFWKLLYSRTKNGSILRNPIDIPYVDANTFFVRAEREYYNGSEIKNYPMGLVIGIDDTPDKFFVHRISRDEDLDDPSTEWTLEKIRSKMGFKLDYNDLEGNLIPKDSVTRIQGNLSIKPHNHRIEKNAYYTECVQDIRTQLFRHYGEFYLKNIGYNIDTNDNIQIFNSGVRIDDELTTVELIELQDELNIDETTVRIKQDEKNIQRLSANLRNDIIEEILLDDLIDWVDSTENIVFEDYTSRKNEKLQYGKFPRNIREIGGSQKFGEIIQRKIFESYRINIDYIHKLTDKHVNSIFETEASQENIVFGNHAVMISNAIVHPSDESVNRLDNNALDKIIVPNESMMIVSHNEHNTRIYSLDKGVYEFRFLEGLDTTVFG